MPRWTPLVDTATSAPVRPGDVPLGQGKECLAGTQIIALFHTAAGWCALDGICPHAGGPLAKGIVSADSAGTRVTCPWHGWQFDLPSGHNCLNPRITTPAFPVRDDGGQLQVDLDPASSPTD